MTPILAQGAEAVLTKEGDTVVKHRIVKSYRIPALDSVLRRSRQRREMKVIERLSKANIAVPAIVAADEEHMKLTLSFIDGSKVRDVLNDRPEQFGKALGGILASMHELGIAHGDPTTSNFIATDKGVVTIDFGLSFFTHKTEDFAVDLHLLRQVLEGTHTLVWERAWASAIAGYVGRWSEGKAVIAWLENKVEKRGRNKRRS